MADARLFAIALCLLAAGCGTGHPLGRLGSIGHPMPRRSGALKTRRVLQEDIDRNTGPAECLPQLEEVALNTSNCFRQCRVEPFGRIKNLYDFAWNHSAALNDLMNLNSKVSADLEFTPSTELSIPCYDTPWPGNMLGSDIALGRPAEQSDVDGTADDNPAGLAVDFDASTCTYSNFSEASPGWWFVNLTTVQEVTFVYLTVGEDMTGVVVYVSDSAEPADLEDGQACNTVQDMGRGAAGWGVWCRGGTNAIGKTGSFVWVTASSAVSLCTVNVYARASNAALFKKVHSSSGTVDKDSAVDNMPSTAALVTSADREAYLTVDLGYSARVGAVSLFHGSGSAVKVAVAVGNNLQDGSEDGSENTVCTSEADIEVPAKSAAVFSCRQAGRYVTLLLPPPVQLQLYEFGVYLEAAPEDAVRAFQPGPWGAPLPSPVAPSPVVPSPADPDTAPGSVPPSEAPPGWPPALPPALPPAGDLAFPPAPNGGAGQSDAPVSPPELAPEVAPPPAATTATYYVSVQLQLVGAPSQWNETVREEQFEPALTAQWNSSGLMQTLDYVNYKYVNSSAAAPDDGRRRLLVAIRGLAEESGPLGLVLEYEVQTVNTTEDGLTELLETISNTTNNGDVTEEVQANGINSRVSLVKSPEAFPESQQGKRSDDMDIDPENSNDPSVAPPSDQDGGGLGSGTIAVIVAGSAALLALLVALGVFVAWRRRRAAARGNAAKSKGLAGHGGGHQVVANGRGLPGPRPPHSPPPPRSLWFDDDDSALEGPLPHHQHLANSNSTEEYGENGENGCVLMSASAGLQPITEGSVGSAPGSVRAPAGRGLEATYSSDMPGSALASPLSEHHSDPGSWRAIASPMATRLSQIERLWQVTYADLDLQKQIGEGSFGKVYLAKWRETIVAVKVLNSGELGASWNVQVPGSEEEALMRAEATHTILESLEKEAAMMATLRHPNVVMYLGICLQPPCVVTEYCARGSLTDVLKRGRLSKTMAAQLDWPRRLNMALDAAKGMLYLHSNDPPIIHRDLKSPNLLVDKHWRVKVCDFNLSRFMEEQMVLSSLAATNPRWLAPEILSGQGYSFSSDVFSFGVIMWELVTWQIPWHEYGPWQVVAMVTEGHSRPELPQPEALPTPPFAGMEEYSALMHDCWAQRPEDRPTFSTIIARLRQMLANEMLANRPGSNRLLNTSSDVDAQLSTGAPSSARGKLLASGTGSSTESAAAAAAAALGSADAPAASPGSSQRPETAGTVVAGTEHEACAGAGTAVLPNAGRGSGDEAGPRGQDGGPLPPIPAALGGPGSSLGGRRSGNGGGDVTGASSSGLETGMSSGGTDDPLRTLSDESSRSRADVSLIGEAAGASDGGGGLGDQPAEEKRVTRVSRGASGVGGGGLKRVSLSFNRWRSPSKRGG